MVNSMPNIPNFVKREIDKLEKLTKPVTKKAYKYIFWSYPLIFISVINLIVILFFTPGRELFNGSIIFFAVLGALGFALSKEAKHQRKEILKLSSDYMVSRIKNSEVVSEHLKNQYVSLVKQQPSRSLQHFIEFLKKENKISYYS
ncbi:DUF5392 family protein [Bacillaceae bacterium W0354]